MHKSTKLRRFFTDQARLFVGANLELPQTEAAHIADSLRMSQGDQVVIFNGKQEFIAELVEVSRHKVEAKLLEELQVQSENNKNITLYMALIRLSNFELVLQKATEIGVSRIVPIAAEFSQIGLERMEKKYDRWNKIIVEACKQSERSSIPELEQTVKIADIPEDESLKLFFTLPRESTNAISPVIQLNQVAPKIATSESISLIIGPEGGFSPTEHQLAKEKGYAFVSLGDKVLKAETAAIYALSVVDYIT